jgi:diguanylate cyclase (GGDEF)-like protein
LRQSDLVGRLGGEEFTVVLADAGRDNAYLVAERLRNAFATNAAVVDGVELDATASIGVSVIIDPSQDLARLITLADQALYLAKARGRNRVEVAAIGADIDDAAEKVAPIMGASEQPAA